MRRDGRRGGDDTGSRLTIQKYLKTSRGITRLSWDIFYINIYGVSRGVWGRLTLDGRGGVAGD